MAQIRLGVREAEGPLPPVCLVCGHAATRVKVKKLVWWPRWTYLLILVHPFVFGIVALLLARSAHVQAPLCDRHEGYWRNRSLLIWSAGLILGSIAAAAFMAAATAAGDIDRRGFEERIFYTSLGGVAMLLLWIILIWIVQSRTIRPIVITRSEIVLTGVSKHFVAAIEESDRARLAPFVAAVEESDRARLAPADHRPEHPGQGTSAESIQESPGQARISRNAIEQ